jgi:putative radical SAM enzyme (TIGR03279 family)
VKRIDRHIIKSVEIGSIAQSLELEAGDELIKVNGKKIRDVFDYRYMIKEEKLNLIVRKANGEEWELDVEKDMDADLGIVFEEGLMDKYNHCHNGCIFCFIDQNPKGMRDTVYFKDDDARLSFLQGNYITMTNLSDDDVNRICFYRLSPINISIQTMNRDLRCMMLNNRFAGDALDKLDVFSRNGIEMNGQVVLCPGINDGKELDYTISELEKYIPGFLSLSIVPVGITRYRQGLYPLRSFSKNEAEQVIRQVEKWQAKFLRKYGRRFVFLSDEWYIKACVKLPGPDYYEGYGQIENGVGIRTCIAEEFMKAMDESGAVCIKPDLCKKQIIVLCGTLAGGFMKELLSVFCKKFEIDNITLINIVNDYYGHEITVSGLITGQDIINQLSIYAMDITGNILKKTKGLKEYTVPDSELKASPVYENGELLAQPLIGQDALEKLNKHYDGKIRLDAEVVMPSLLLRDGEELLLDDITVKDIENALQTRIHIVKSDGNELIKMLYQLENKRG